MKMISKETVADIKDMYFNLFSVESIAKKMNISIPTVKRYIKNEGFLTLWEVFAYQSIAFDLAKQGKITLKDENYPLDFDSYEDFELVFNEYSKQTEFCTAEELAKKYYEKRKL